ncbi:hypothetical protein KSP39_PZI022739 [Platanthera zijinensis]|uniref:Uncharacterized protein n=1 Tax=Platanthera zijinensis TaxID=2320716 RepID=A0AAP0AUS8_9ASPA
MRFTRGLRWKSVLANQLLQTEKLSSRMNEDGRTEVEVQGRIDQALLKDPVGSEVPMVKPLGTESSVGGGQRWAEHGAMNVVIKDRGYTPVSGFHGILAGFLVGIKQLMPDQELSFFFLLKIRAKWVPTLLAIILVAVSVFIREAVSYLPIVLFGIYMGWLYLRYFQKNSESGLKGDPSDEFSFSSFFPEFLRPILDPVALLFDKMLCGKRFHTSSESSEFVLGGVSLPGSDPIEASRRRYASCFLYPPCI